MESDLELERRLRDGDDAALALLLDRNRERLLRAVQLRLDPRLARRIDPEDVVQEAYVDAAQRLAAFRGDDKPFLLWIRLVLQQTMIGVHRRHLGAAMRNAGREIKAPPSGTLSDFFVARVTSPSNAAMRLELRQRVESALESMDDIDREVLLLRHFEDLSNKETAAVLGIQENAASNRYVRALARLEKLLGELGGP